MKAADLTTPACLFGVLKWRHGGIHLQQRLSAQRWADGIKMWPKTVLAFNHSLCVQIVCLGFLWINLDVDKWSFFLIWSLNLNPNLKSWSAGYTMLHYKLKTKIDIITKIIFMRTCMYTRYGLCQHFIVKIHWIFSIIVFTILAIISITLSANRVIGAL